MQSPEQKIELKRLRKKLKSALNYKPMGQGDGMNQSLVIKEIHNQILQVKNPFWTP